MGVPQVLKARLHFLEKYPPILQKEAIKVKSEISDSILVEFVISKTWFKRKEKRKEKKKVKKAKLFTTENTKYRIDCGDVFRSLSNI